MGVQHLWNILEQSKRLESIEQLREKTLCIDLSLWICEAQGTKGLKDQLKPYLRNVFFRTMYLVSIGVRPIFVIDGIPPEIKHETILKRLQARLGHPSKRPVYNEKQKKLKRSKFSIWCNECCEMLSLIGIPFVKSEGEAEAMCAWLNVNKYADGVLTDDGDVFLYGAKVVYKDFNISSSKSLIDCLQVFDIEDIETRLGLHQRNMIALALLLGCDYLPTGVPGIGKETALRLLSSLPGVDLLGRFHEWSASPDFCPENYSSLEVSVKRKAMKVPDFPNEAVINEFLSPKVGSKNISIKWRCPDLEGIKEFFLRKLDWPKDYTEEKMLNLATDWQLANSNTTAAPLFVPIRIVKQRVKQKVEYYELEWQTQDVRSKWPTTFKSVKAKEVICQKYSTIVEGFEREISEKKRKGKVKRDGRNKTGSVDDIGLLEAVVSKMENIDLNRKMTSLACDENSDIVAHTQDNSEDTKSKREKQKCVSKHNAASQLSILDEVSEIEKLGLTPVSILGNSPTRDLENLNVVKPPMSDLDKEAVMMDLKELKRSKAVAVFNENEEESQCVTDINQSHDYDCVKTTSSVCATSANFACSYVFTDSPLLECGLDRLNKYLQSPATNEKTMFNLVDITVDQSSGADAVNIEDLLASSFVSELTDMSRVDRGSPGCIDCCVTSPYFKEASPDPNYAFLNIHEDTRLGENIGILDLSGKNGVKRENTVQKENPIRQRYGCNVDEIGFSKPRTPTCIEESSLTSRLMKRFLKEDGGIADTLKMISSDGGTSESEVGKIEKNIMSDTAYKITKKQTETYTCKFNANVRTLYDITNLREDIDYVVVD